MTANVWRRARPWVKAQLQFDHAMVGRRQDCRRARHGRSFGSGMTDRPTDPDLTVAQLGEFGLIDRLARILHGSGRDPLRPEATGPIGIGDDAALWQPTPGRREVLTTDALIEGVHFRHRTTSWRDLGW